ncbi:MAG: hypothetical protein GWP08_05235 [Nitrospiraceae bacterium]|nr:hypothetical protein [Nitrospiraceae bacterium]
MKMMSVVALSLALCVSALPAFAAGAGFVEFTGFPQTAKYNVVGAALPDGRLVVWNGADVYAQVLPGADSFAVIASGYDGDPAFIALSPDGHTVLMGAGGFADPYTNQIYLLDTSAPADFAPEAVVLTRAHFSAVYLTENLVLIDAGTPSFASELVIMDLAAKSAPAPVVVKTGAYAKAQVVDKPGYSTLLALDPASGRVYAMDGASRELRYFSRSALVNAFNAASTLDWAADGALVGAAGDYFGGGVSGVTPEGNLVIGGSEGWGLPGGVQIVDPDTGSVVESLDPDGAQGYTSVIYNPVADTIVAVVGTTAYTDAAPANTPVAGMAALVVLGGALMATALKRRH